MTAHTPAECGKKWWPLVKGLHGSQMEVVAWVIEQEVRHLQEVHKSQQNTSAVDKATAGARMKLTLPALRMAAAKLVPVSAVVRLARVMTWPACLTIEEVRAEVDEAILAVQATSPVEWQGTRADIAFLACPLSERLYESLLAYPGTA